MIYSFNTCAQAKQFMKRLRKNGILSEQISKHDVQIVSFELINELMKPIVLATAKRAYSSIMG